LQSCGRLHGNVGGLPWEIEAPSCQLAGVISR
jgi:hypothetical protein